MSYLVVMGPVVDGVCACVYSSSLEAVCASVCTVLGAGKKNTKTCIRVSIKLNNIIKKWTMLVSSGYTVNSLSNQSLQAENVCDFRTCVCVCVWVLCIQFVPVLCVVWSLWAERRSVGWRSSHTLEAYRSKSATSCRPECPDSRSSLQHRRERTSRNEGRAKWQRPKYKQWKSKLESTEHTAVKTTISGVVMNSQIRSEPQWWTPRPVLHLYVTFMYI